MVLRSMPLLLHTFTVPSSLALAMAEPSWFHLREMMAATPDASTRFSSRPVLE